MAAFAPFFEKQMNPLKFVLHQDMIKQYQKYRHQGADKKHTNQSPPSNQMSQIADRRDTRYLVYNISGTGQDRTGCQNRRNTKIQRPDRRFLLIHRLAAFQIIVRRQNRIIDGRAQLDTAYDNVTNENHRVSDDVRYRHIDENRDLNRNHDKERNNQ